jgi:hypothetical protein
MDARRPSTEYFQSVVRIRRPYLTETMIEAVIANPHSKICQTDSRWRYFAKVADLNDRWLRVVLLEDDRTLHNAFLDRDGPPKTSA